MLHSLRTRCLRLQPTASGFGGFLNGNVLRGSGQSETWHAAVNGFRCSRFNLIGFMPVAESLIVLCQSCQLPPGPAEGHPRGLAIASLLGHDPKTPLILPIRVA